jgi:hypothetical protein
LHARVNENQEDLMETTEVCTTIEQARNAAIKWLEDRRVTFGPHREVARGRLGVMEGSEVGVCGTVGTFWRIRLDYDPVKGPHYNVEFGRGASRQKKAFSFLGTQETMSKIARRRAPR